MCVTGFNIPFYDQFMQPSLSVRVLVVSLCVCTCLCICVCGCMDVHVCVGCMDVGLKGQDNYN